MKIKIIKWLFLSTLLLSDIMSGQEIKVSYAGESASGGILYSLSRLDIGGKVMIETSGIFSSVKIVNLGLRQGVIASIDIVGYKSDKSINCLDQLWLYLNDELRVVFYYPVGTKMVYGLKDGVSLFSYDHNCDIVGAIDSIGHIIMQPKYEYITKNGRYMNGINRRYGESSSVVFECSVFKYGEAEPNYTYDVFFDDKVPIYVTVHNEYSKLIDCKTFSDMLQDIDYHYDVQLYLKGIHEFLNMNYKKALSYFEQIENKDSFRYLSNNIQQCNELIRQIS